MKELNFNALEEDIYKYKNIIYGAGDNGKFIFKLLEDKGVEINDFYDDDITRGVKVTVVE